MQLVERESDLAVLRHAVAAAATGAGCVVLVHGEPGIGKTALVTAFVAELPTGTRVLTGTCDDLVTPRVYGPLRDAARGAGPLAVALREGADTTVVLDALLAEVDHPLAPTVLILDDVHWADEATLDAAGFLGRRIGNLHTVLVLSYRTTDVAFDHPLRRVVAQLPPHLVHRIDLSPLSTAAIATLCGCDVDRAAEVQVATAGNPLFVAELSRWDGAGIPATIRDTVLARLARLPADEQRTLGLLAVFPGAAERPLLRELSGDTGLDEAERQGLVRVDAQTVGFVHGLVREAVATALPTSTLIAHHETIARHLEARDADPVRILHHAVPAGLGDLVATLAPTAAWQASRAGSHREALAHLEHLVSFPSNLSAEDLAAAYEQLSWEQQLADRHGDAVDSAVAAVRLRSGLGDPESLAQAQVVESRARYWHGGQAAARVPIERALAVLDDLPPGPVHALAHAHRARLDLLSDRLADATAWAERALAATATTAVPLAEVGARVTVAAVRLAQGDLDAVAELDDLVARAATLQHHETVVRAEIHLASGLLRQGHLHDASRRLERAAEYTRSNDVAYGLQRVHALQALVDVEAGRLESAEDRSKGILPAIGDLRALRVLPASVHALARIRRGGEDGRDLAELAWRLGADTDEPRRLGIAAVARAEHGWHQRDAVATTAAATAALDLLLERGHLWYAGLLAMAVARSGGEPPEMTDCPEGMRLSLAGDHTAAAAWFAERGWAFQAAVERVRGWDEADRLDALAWLDHVGAAGTAAVARAWLRDAGVRSIPRGPTTATRQNPAGLTTRQIDVMRLVAAGLTNSEIAARLFLSTRTVDHHVSAILGKLGVASREEVAARAAELGVEV
jgi:DNA-binding CsgD family transcriptional regulator